MSKVVIAGGGLAGLACAKRLVDAGYQVEVLEAESRFGGRATSWIDPTGGHEIESGIHSYFGIYSRLSALLREVGVSLDRMLSWDETITFLEPGPHYHVFGVNPVRALPQVLAGVFGNNAYVGPRDKLGLARAFSRGLHRRGTYAYETVQGLAYESRVSRAGYERILRPLMRSLFFLEPEELAAYAPLTLALHALSSPGSVRAGTFKGGMGQVMIAPLVRWLEGHGVTLRTGSPIQAIRHAEGDPHHITGFELAGGEVVRGRAYVSALPLQVLQTILPAAWADTPYFTNLLRLETVPAISVQLWFESRLVDLDGFVFVPASPMVIFQDQSHITFPRYGSRISCQVVDPAVEGYTDRRLIDLVIEQVRRSLLSSATAQVEKAEVVRHRAFAMRTGAQAQRPEQASPLRNFYLAGDYTRQEWFTTMEGAARSGEMAAASLITALGPPRA